jgi:ribosomal-protein-alanine N-acetyltransferase
MIEKKITPPSIRKCRLQDIDAVLDLWKQADAIPSVTDTAEDLRRAIADPAANVLVSELGERLVGSIIGTFDGWRGNIYRLAVHPDCRRRGIGRALLAAVEQYLAKQGTKRITALVSKHHSWATGFWQAVGYGRDDRIVRHVRTLEASLPSDTASTVSEIVVNDQVHLSELQSSDMTACLEHLKEKEIYDRTLRMPYPYTEANFQDWLRIVATTTKDQGRPVHWAIRDENNGLIGGCGFVSLEVGKSHRAEIGYWLAKPYWGRGIMTAVVRRLCEHAFSEFGVTKIEAHVFAENIASVKVLEKCGFRQEGYLRKHHLKEGKYLDARLLALVKE